MYRKNNKICETNNKFHFSKKINSNNIKQSISDSKGITLIAVTVTVIVLLILALITINAIIGDNGILTGSEKFKNKENEFEQQQIDELEEIESNTMEALSNETNVKDRMFTPEMTINGPKNASSSEWYCGTVTVKVKDETPEEKTKAVKIRYEVKGAEEKSNTVEIPQEGERAITFTIENEGISSVKSYLQDINGKEKENGEEQIIKIDKTKPEDVKITKLSQTARGITVQGSANEKVSEVKYTYQYKESSSNDADEQWKNAPNGVNTSENIYTYPSTVINEETEYDIRVIATDSAGNTEKSLKEKVKTEKANYSIKKASEKIYYNTFLEAYENSVSEGGDEGGGTIVVERDVKEQFEVLQVNKTITIDLQLNTLDITNTLHLLSGTLTVKGEDSDEKTGTLRCSGDDTILFRVEGGNIATTGRPHLESTSHAIYTMADSVGSINIDGGYIESLERSAISFNGTGDLYLNDAYVYAPTNNKNGITTSGASKVKVTIGGNSIICNGTKDSGASSGSGAISISGESSLTIKDNAIITSGLYGTNAVNYYKGEKLQILDNAKLYTGSDKTHRGLQLNRDANASGTVELIINTKGGIFTTAGSGDCIDNLGANTFKLNITAGTFCGTTAEPLLKLKPSMTNYPEAGTAQTIEFPYLENYKTVKTKALSNIYSVKVGN